MKKTLLLLLAMAVSFALAYDFAAAQMGPGMMGGYGGPMMEEPESEGWGYGRGYGYGGYGMGPGMMGGYGYGMGPGMMHGGYGRYGGWGMGPGMMHGYGMGPGMMGGGYGCAMGPGMMGGYGMGPGMMGGWGYGEETKEFLDSTKELRRQIHAKMFDYMEAARDPETSREELDKIFKEMRELQKQLREKARAK